MCIRFSRGAPPKKRRFSTVTRKSKAQPPHAIRVGYFIYITVSLISTKPSDFAKPGAQPSFRRRDAQTSGEVGRCQVCCWSRWRFVVGYFVAGNIPLMKIDKTSNSEIVRFWQTHVLRHGTFLRFSGDFEVEVGQTRMTMNFLPSHPCILPGARLRSACRRRTTVKTKRAMPPRFFCSVTFPQDNNGRWRNPNICKTVCSSVLQNFDSEVLIS